MTCRICKVAIEDMENAILMVSAATLLGFCGLDCFGMFAFENEEDDLKRIKSDA